MAWIPLLQCSATKWLPPSFQFLLNSSHFRKFEGKKENICIVEIISVCACILCSSHLFWDFFQLFIGTWLNYLLKLSLLQMLSSNTDEILVILRISWSSLTLILSYRLDVILDQMCFIWIKGNLIQIKLGIYKVFSSNIMLMCSIFKI